MQGRKELNPKMMYQVHLDDLVPHDNFYRKLNTTLDLRFLYKATAPYYGYEGQESIDPVVFFKICLVGYLNNLNSDRKLIDYCSNCLDIRLFIRYDIDEPLPWHSTISRTRQLYGEEVFLQLFRKVLKMCIDKGMVRGKRQALDSALIKANASLDSLEEKPVLSDVEAEVLDDVQAYTRELNENSKPVMHPATDVTTPEQITPSDKSNRTVTPAKAKDVEQHHEWKKEAYKDQPHGSIKDQYDEHGNLIRPKYLSNHTHFSPTDPDARIAVKPGKARQMNYFAQVAVDQAHHVITGAGADFADKRDSECLAHIVTQTQNNLKENQMVFEQITADAGYSSAEALHFCNQQNIDAYIPNFGQYKPERDGFIYNKELDQYECVKDGGNKAILPFKKIANDRSNLKRIYRSDNSKCKTCPLRSTCIGKSDFKKIEDTLHKDLYDNMHHKLKTRYAKRLLKERSSTVEPVLGTLLNFLGMRRVNARGIKQANKHVMMAALTYNLKKYLRFISRKSVATLQALEQSDLNSLKNCAPTLFTLVLCIMVHYRKQAYRLYSPW